MKKILTSMLIAAFKERPFVPEDNSKPKSNLQIFEEVIKIQ